MDKELQVQLNTIIQNMATKNDIQDVRNEMAKIENRVDDLTGIMLNFENNITTRLESLFDGYMLNHDKQRKLERKVEELESRLAALEIKTA